ncbi:MAG: phospholipid carrier-dependent glycosyltransferase [Thermoanaerobaculum sp.]|nr:phospholipid carrier-dependent glycosyltransferase [Thermoanaerobaculum sp.]
MRTKQLYFFAIGVLTAAFVATMPFRSLFEPDESRYALVAQGMLQEGHWLVPHLEGRPYTHKPPLYLWCVAALRKLGLPWTAAAVLPSFIPALILLLALPRLTQSFGVKPEAGYLSGVLLVASPLYATMALAARMDMLLALATTMAFAAAYQLLTAELSPRAVGRWRWTFWLSLGLGVMSKGPVALALVFLTLALFAAVSRQALPWNHVFGGWVWLAPLMLILAWFIPAAWQQGWEWVEEILFWQSAGRMVKSFAHQEPFYFHLITWPLTGFPTALLALWAAVTWWRRREDSPERFLASAFLAILLFFSAISGKLIVYLLPLVPVAVLLVGRLVSQGAWGSRWLWGASATTGLLLGLALASAAYWRPELTPWRGLITPIGFIVATFSAVGLYFAFRGHHRRALLATVAAGLSFTGVVLPVMTHILDQRLAVRALAQRYRQLCPGESSGLVFRDFLSGLPLYAGMPFQRLKEVEELQAALRSGKPVVMTQRDWEQAAGLLNLPVHLERFSYRGSWLLIVQPAKDAQAVLPQQRL